MSSKKQFSVGAAPKRAGRKKRGKGKGKGAKGQLSAKERLAAQQDEFNILMLRQKMAMAT